MAVMLLADARLAASIMRSCSNTEVWSLSSLTPCVWNDKDIVAAQGFVEADADFAVGEFADLRIGQLDAQVVGDLSRKFRMRTPC